MQQNIITLNFDRGNYTDLTDFRVNNIQLYKFAYYSTNGNHTYLCLNEFTLPTKAFKWGRRPIDGVDSYYIKVCQSSSDYDYAFMKKPILGRDLLLLVQDHTKNCSKSSIRFVIDESDFLKKLQKIEIDEYNHNSYKFDFPAVHNPSLLPQINYPNDNIQNSPDIEEDIKKFGAKNRFQRRYRQEATDPSSLTLGDLESDESDEPTERAATKPSVKVSHIREQMNKNKPETLRQLPKHMTTLPPKRTHEETISIVEQLKQRLKPQDNNETSMAPTDFDFSPIVPSSSIPPPMPTPIMTKISSESRMKSNQGPSVDDEDPKLF